MCIRDRIGTEVRRMLDHKNRARALRLLIESGLWEQVLPKTLQGFAGWSERIILLEQLDSDFPTTLAALLAGTGVLASELQDAWRLKNEEVSKADWILANQSTLSTATELRWSQLQPLLISEHAKFALDLLQGMIDAAMDEGLVQSSVDLCRKKLSLEPPVLDPEPLLSGKDLMELGMTPGPQFKSILEQVRAMQLDGELSTPQQARQWVGESSV